jgi:pilus assembly protein CpaE
MRTLVSSDNDKFRDLLRQVALNTGLECCADDCVPYAHLAKRLVQGDAELILVAMDEESKRSLTAIQEAAAKGQAPIVAVGPTNDPQLILEAMRAGAREYIDRAKPRDGLMSTVEKLRVSGSIRFLRGHTIGVVGAIPGTGVTTVATGLAFSLAAKHAGEVVLAELGGGVPQLALDLDIKPRNNVAQVLVDWDRMDTKTLQQALVEHRNGLRVLADAPGALDSPVLAPQSTRQIIALLRSMYPYVVADLGHGVTSVPIQEALDFVERIVVVFRLDVPSLRLTQVLCKKLDDRGVDSAKVYLVANRYGQRRQISWKKAEEILGREVASWVPDDPKRINQSINKGLPLLQSYPWSAITRTFGKLAQSVNGATTTKKK